MGNNGLHARAIHRDGTLELLTPLELAEGEQVEVIVVQTEFEVEQVEEPRAPKLTHPTRLVAASRLDDLTGLVAVGGDALEDSEALYD